MKKFFKKAFVMLSIVIMGFATTSCGVDEIVENLLPYVSQLLGNIFKNGTTNEYKGEYVAWHLYETADGFVYDGDSVSLQNQVVKAVKNDQNISITVPAVNVGRVKMSEVTLYDLVLDKDSKLTLGDNSRIDGTLEINGEAILASNLFIDGGLSEMTGDITHEKFVIKGASIYFGEEEDHAVNICFEGTIVSNK